MYVCTLESMFLSIVLSLGQLVYYSSFDLSPLLLRVARCLWLWLARVGWLRLLCLVGRLARVATSTTIAWRQVLEMENNSQLTTDVNEN